MNKQILIEFVLDKSGSMDSVKDATISGFNEYIGNLRREQGVDYFLSLTLFDTLFKQVCVGKPLSSFEDLTEKTYSPGSSTALYDAVADAIKKSDGWLKGEADHHHTYQVLCVIMTDGEENSSKQYNRQDIFDLIKQKESTGYWTFAYLGANQDSWEVGTSIGVHGSSTMNFVPTSGGMLAALDTLTTKTKTYSRQAAASTPDFFADNDDKDRDKDKK